MQVTEKHKKQFQFNVETEEGDKYSASRIKDEEDDDDEEYGVPDRYEGQSSQQTSAAKNRPKNNKRNIMKAQQNKVESLSEEIQTIKSEISQIKNLLLELYRLSINQT